jgi:hypothetical protein
MKASKPLDTVNDFLKRAGWGELDGRNASLIRKGNASIAVVAVPDKDLLLVSSPVITLPEENLLPLFRKLLTLNLTETQDAAFALNEEAGTIDLQIKRPLQDLDYREFDRAVSTLAAMADRYNDPLASSFGSDVVLPQAPKGGRWTGYVSALNPLTTVVRQEDLKDRIQRIRAGFSVIGLMAAIGAAIFAFNRTRSWALAIFTFLWVQYTVVRIIPDLITDSDKIRRFIFFMLHPAVAVGLLCVTHVWWGKWWLSALIGYFGGILLARLIGIVFMPRVALEETRDDQERKKAWLGSQGRV